MAEEKSAGEIEQTAMDMNLPLEYVEEIYREDAEKPTDAPVEESISSPPASTSDSDRDTGIPENLASRAKVYGLDPDKFRDEAALRDQMDAYDRQMLDQYRQSMQQQQAAQQTAQQPEGQSQETDARFVFDLGDEYDQEEVEKFNAGLQKVADHFNSQIDQLTQAIQYMVQSSQSEQIESTNAAFDKAVDGLGVDQFGEGRYDDLTPTEQAARQTLMDTATSLVNVYNQRGIPVPEIEDLVQQSFRLAFADESKKANQSELRDKIVRRSRKRQGTGNSRHRPGTAKDWNGPPEENPYLLGKYKELLQEQDFK